MTSARRIFFSTLALTLLVGGAAAAQEIPDSLPQGVTADMVREGATLYNGQGLCMACHGPDGKGQGGLAADLTDEEWAHSDGSYEKIIEQVVAGVEAEKSTTGIAMPARGGSMLTDEQVRAVAAYVWSLSRIGS